MGRKDLNIGAGFRLPLQWMTMSSVVYGTRGSGKSTLGRKLAEEVAAHGQRFCAIDPTGAWWGLKSSEAGTDVGLPVIIFGGDHADVPLEPGAGEEIASVVAEIGQSAILDLELLSKGKQIKFLGAFLARLYHINRDPLMLLMDEAQRYAPQQPQGPEASITLGAAEDIVKLGRKHGLGPVVFTQRGSGLNKEVSELADVLIAFRTPGVLDQKRIKEWLEANATEAQMKEVMATVSGLPTGTAIFASNHPDLKIFGTIAIDRPWTFDSSATPQVGQRRKEPKILAKADIEALSVRMADAIERSKAEDPKELRKRIAALERDLRGAPRSVPLQLQRVEVPVEKVVEIEVPALREMDHQLVQDLIDGLEGVSSQVGPIRDLLVSRMAAIDAKPSQPKAVAPPPSPVERPKAPARPPVDRDVSADNGDLKLGKAERQILAALQTHAEGLTRKQIALVTGYRAGVSTLSVALGRLRRLGLVTPGEPIEATGEGRRVDVGEIDPVPPPGPERITYWMGKLGKAEREILSTMAEAHPDELTRTEIAERAGYNPDVSTLSVALGKLRRMKLIEGFRVSEELMGQ